MAGSDPPMQRSEFRLLDRLRVRWAEIDAQQIVFNAHYLMYFDTAIGAYWRALLMPYAPTMAALGGDLYVRKATLEYLGSARYDDVLDVGMRCAQIGNSSLRFDAAVFRGEHLLVSGELVYVFADVVNQAPRPVPAALRAVIEAFEAGASMVDVQLGDWATLGAQAQAIRSTVFVDEQKVPAALEMDVADASALHAVAHNRFGLAVATGRLLQDAPGVARIGRMAVLPIARGSGVGAQLLDALLQAARERGDRRAVLHAQVPAKNFYRRAGFVIDGREFVEAGIAHVAMSRLLNPV
jgi:YbgC/YbaW family acyl-CoA thioester hydrolase